MKSAAVFDPVAPQYDAEFGGVLGRTYRRAAWRWLDRAFPPGASILELGCGTGEDAVHLTGRGVRVVATDPSAGMLAVARGKLPAGDLRQLAVAELAALAPEFPAAFDGAFSNFGGFNLVADVPAAARALAALLRPGAPLLLCIMGRHVPWEWAWFLLRGRPGKAFRRLAPGGATWRGVRVRYPSAGAVARACAPWFRVVRTGGLGVLLPPPYTERWARGVPRLIETLDRWERRVETWPLFPALGDHYMIEFARR